MELNTAVTMTLSYHFTVIPLSVLGHFNFIFLPFIRSEMPIQMLTILGFLLRHEPHPTVRTLNANIHPLDDSLKAPAST